MGCARRRLSPRIANQVNRDLDRLMTKTIVGVVKRLPPPWDKNTFGRPCWDPRTVAVACFMKIFFNRSYDGIEAYLKSNPTLNELLHTGRLPGHSVIARGMHSLSMKYIRKVLRYITLQFRKRGMDVIVDSSGFRLKTSSTWFDIRIQHINSKKEHIKLHIVVDAETLLILSFTITSWRGSDSKEFSRLINQLPTLGKVLGDKAYSSRKNCQLVANKGGTPYLCFKTNTTGRSKGYPAWNVSFKLYSSSPERWMGEYHIRSVIEAVFSSIKRCWGHDIKSKNGWLKRRELALKVVGYDIKRAQYIERANELGISLWV